MIFGAITRNFAGKANFLIEFVEVAPGENERQDFRLAGTCRHFYDIPRPVLVEHAGGNGARSIKAN